LIPAGALEEDETAAATGARFDELPLDSIEPNPRQPREVFDEDSMAELVASIREVGVLQPVVVREVGPGRYQLIMGERRWRACREAGVSGVPAIIRETADDQLLRDALLENLHRQQLNPLEEAAAYQQLLAEFGATHDELADRIGRSRSQVSNTIRLLALPPAVQRRVAAGVLSAGHARALLSLADAEAQDRLASRIVAEGLSVRATEEIVSTDHGDETKRPALRRARAGSSLPELADGLADLLDTQVRVDVGRNRGKLTIGFASMEDLRRIMAVVAPALSATIPVAEPGPAAGSQAGEPSPAGSPEPGSAEAASPSAGSLGVEPPSGGDGSQPAPPVAAEPAIESGDADRRDVDRAAADSAGPEAAASVPEHPVPHQDGGGHSGLQGTGHEHPEQQEPQQH
jgi:ParB family chromosome partitioning protein